MTDAPPSRQPTLRKLAADLSWFLETAGVEPESVVVSFGVKSTEDQSLLISAFLKHFDASVMQRTDKYPQMVVLNGIPVWCLVNQRSKEAA